MNIRDRLTRLERNTQPTKAGPMTVELVFREPDGSYVDVEGKPIDPHRPGAKLIEFG